MNKVCRVCLEEGGVLSSIFTRNYNLSMCEMIEYCCNITITRNDGLPGNLCSSCMYKLGVAYHFKQSCESSETRLRRYLGLSSMSKKSDACIMTDPVPVATTQVTVIKKCKCQPQKKQSRPSYKRKPEEEKLKRGPKPKPKQVHSCYNCGKEFRCQTQLEMHVRTHTGEKPFSCMYCDRSFAQKHNLQIHQRIHTGEKPFQCDVCSKRFSAQGNLHTHLKIHTGQKDHVCNLCQKGFITSSELTRHMCKHRGHRDYKCDVCEAAFVQSRDLKLHKLKKHQIAPAPSKPETETISNAPIDIIGIDVGKDLSEFPPKTDSVSQATELKNHLDSNPSQNSLLQLCDVKSVKDSMYQFTMTPEKPNCSICGEQFDYIALLAQHCLKTHNMYV